MSSANLPYFHDGWPRFWGYGPANRAATGPLWLYYARAGTGPQTITGSFTITILYKGSTTVLHWTAPSNLDPLALDSGVVLDDTTSPLRITVTGYSCPQYDAVFNTPPCFGPQGDPNHDSGSFGDLRDFSIAAFIGDPSNVFSSHFQATTPDGGPYQD